MYVLAHNGSSILGGGEIGTALLLAGLQARGHRVKMLCRDAEMAERVARYGIPTGVARVGGDAMLPDALRFAAALRRERPDALVLTTFKKVFLAGMGARLAGVPRVVQRIVLSTDVPRGARYRLALRRFVDVIALNAAVMRPAFLAADPELDPTRVRTLYDGVRVPPRTAAPGAVRRALGLPEGARTVGAVARLAKQKRFERLLGAVALLPPDVHCVLAGEGPEHAALEALAAELGIADRVHFLGFRRDVGDVLDAIDVHVVCSDKEGMANAMLEAMAAGVPVVSTPVSGAEEALEPLPDGRRPGLLVAPGPAEIAEALRGMLEDPARLAEMSAAARERVEERFSYEGFLDRWERLLEERP
ncbi:MAG TPA: glycosyltransferase [Longimicrobiaceae bacterium]|jgi:glycosyltransferase involved in cell wall biosynthesis